MEFGLFGKILVVWFLAGICMLLAGLLLHIDPIILKIGVGFVVVPPVIAVSLTVLFYSAWMDRGSH